MPLIPLKIPAGVYRNGTDYEGSGRWRDANLVRWSQGSMRPVGGWKERFTTDVNAPPRAMHAWVDNSVNSRIAMGTYNKLWYVNVGGATKDITPPTFELGAVAALTNTGYGGGYYGTSLYSRKRPYSGVFQEADSWTLDNWGEYLIACSTSDGRIFEWDLDETVGTEEITNGTFDADSDWTKGTGWTIASGVASFSGTAIDSLNQTISGLTDGDVYELTFTLIGADDDEARVRFNSTFDSFNEVFSTGTHTVRFQADATSGTLHFEPASATTIAFDVDNVTMNKTHAAKPIENAPINNKAIIVTEERFVFALASGGNPRKIAWCDREDNTTWTPLATNEAGDIELQTSGEIMCGVRMRGRTLILTTLDAHVATYQGPPYVYGFERVGTACGAVSRKSAVSFGQNAFWMGREGFYMFDGSVALPMQCEVQDYVFDDLNINQVTKVNAVHNSEYGEVWWFYPSKDSVECDSYVAYDYHENHWEIGKINRTCGVDQGVFSDPIWADEDGTLYDHEIHGFPHGDYTPYVESGPISLGNGDTVMKVNQLIGDEKTAGDVQVKFKTRFHPNDVEREYGTYSLTSIPTSVRFTGRQVRIRLEATGDEDWRVGTMRINAETGGRR